MRNAIIRIRVDKKLKTRATHVLRANGLDLEEAIRLFLIEVTRSPGRSVRFASQRQLWAMKRRQQTRDHAGVAQGKVHPESVLLLRPSRLEGATIEWPPPGVPLVDE
jgi:addiction module RelB/DinJ family antitoxin